MKTATLCIVPAVLSVALTLLSAFVIPADIYGLIGRLIVYWLGFSILFLIIDAIQRWGRKQDFRRAERERVQDKSEVSVLTPREMRQAVAHTMQHMAKFRSSMTAHKGNDAWLMQFLSHPENRRLLREKIKRFTGASMNDEEIVTYVTWYFREMI